MPLLCHNCGLALEGGDDAALFICQQCGLVHAPGEEGLSSFSPWTAAVTTELAVAGDVRYLAMWRVAVSLEAAADSAWERIRRIVAPAEPDLYVPAFTLIRPVVQRLGVRLTEAQPVLELTRGLEKGVIHRPSLVQVGRDGHSEAGASGVAAEPGFGTFSPVVTGREDARVLAHFVYLAVESYETHDLRSVDYELRTTGEELVFVPAVWDPRQIHESNWRLLLREFDGLVA
ncbi:MAG: hypothetical protein JXA87_10175 [Thermoleophilia bacterium]|nr:hypothetical protein [Thermoleophilia bacterium]